MRHFNLAVVAFAALAVSFGCGSSGAHLDGGGGDMSGNQDFSTGGGADMTVLKASACGSIYDCLGQGKSLATCEAKSPAASKTKFANFLGCMQQTCGVMGTDAGAGAPCMQAGDMGVSNCNQCFTNVISSSATTMTFFVDAMGNPVVCAADGTAGTPAGDCGTCIDLAASCIFECYADVDCAQLTHSDGTPATCDTTSNQCM
jgi:hypothetical protein